MNLGFGIGIRLDWVWVWIWVCGVFAFVVGFVFEDEFGWLVG